MQPGQSGDRKIIRGYMGTTLEGPSSALDRGKKTARRSGVNPSVSVLSIEAPAASKPRTASASPVSAAVCSGPPPSAPAVSMLACAFPPQQLARHPIRGGILRRSLPNGRTLRRHQYPGWQWSEAQGAEPVRVCIHGILSIGRRVSADSRIIVNLRPLDKPVDVHRRPRGYHRRRHHHPNPSRRQALYSAMVRNVSAEASR